MKRMNWN